MPPRNETPTPAPAPTPPNPAGTPPEPDTAARMEGTLRDVEADAAEQRAEQAKADFESLRIVENMLFGPPDSTQGSFLRSAWDRLQINPKYKEKKEWAQATMREIAQKLTEAFKKREELHARTRAKLGDVELGRQFAVVGHALQLKNRVRTGGETGPLTAEDVVAITRHVEYMASLNIEELVDMIFDSGDFVDMLAEQTKMPTEERPEIKMLDPRNRDYQKNMDNLYLFISGAKVEHEKAPSEFRKMAEGMLWQEIVATLGKRQKRDLLVVFLTRAPVDKTKEFIAGCIITGAMNRRELLEIYDEGSDPASDNHGLFMRLGERPEFDKLLQDGLKAQKIVQQRIAEQVRQIEHPQIRSAIDFFTKDNKVIVETLGRIGALAAIVTTITSISSEWNEKGRKWTQLPAAIALGVKEAAKTPHVLGGIALAGWASNYIYPWAQEWVNKPSGQEKDTIAYRRAEEYVKEQANGHHELFNYFVGHYDRLLALAKQRENQEGRKANGETFIRAIDLYPGDLTDQYARERLKITPDDAARLGFQSPQEAEAAIIRLFGICAKTLKLQPDKPGLASREELIRYLEQKRLNSPYVMAGIRYAPPRQRRKTS